MPNVPLTQAARIITLAVVGQAPPPAGAVGREIQTPGGDVPHLLEAHAEIADSREELAAVAAIVQPSDRSIEALLVLLELEEYEDAGGDDGLLCEEVCVEFGGRV